MPHINSSDDYYFDQLQLSLEDTLLEVFANHDTRDGLAKEISIP